MKNFAIENLDPVAQRLTMKEMSWDQLLNERCRIGNLDNYGKREEKAQEVLMDEIKYRQSL